MIINGTKYSSREIYAKQQPISIPLDGLSIEKTILETNITFESLQELHFHNRDRMESIERTTQLHISASLGLFIIVIITAIGVALSKYYRRTNTWCLGTKGHRATSKEEIIEEGSASDKIEPGQLDLQGGAVTS